MEMEVVAAGGDERPAKEECFDCSICLEPAGEPVVTHCGHLYCRPCVRRWMRADHPAARHCPVCKAALSEDRLLPLYGRGRRSSLSGSNVEHSQDDGYVVGDLNVRSMDCIQVLHGQQRGGGAIDHRGSALHSNAGLVRQQSGGGAIDHWGSALHSNAGLIIGSALPWAFPGSRLTLPPRPEILCDGRRQRKVAESLHQIWLFLAVSALLCFLLS